MTIIYLAMGSNLGHRRRNLAQGMQLLGAHVDVQSVSSVYESAPVGVREQPSFLNLVLVGTTGLSPPALLDFVKEVEHQTGRRTTYRWGPRVLDVDILLYGNQSVRHPDLTIPHPEMLKRGFVVIPLCEIAPDVRLPDGSMVCSAGAAAEFSGQTLRPAGRL